MCLYATVEELVSSYVDYLTAVYPESLPMFKRRLNDDKEAATAEAIVFGVLQNLHARPEVNELPGTGGADFLCAATGGSPIFALREPDPSSRFVVEVTSLDSASVSNRSHLPNEIVDGGGGAFDLITSAILAKAKKKIPQLKDHPMPRVLALVSSHAQVGALINTYAAQEVLVSRIQWRHEIGSNEVDRNEYTDLSMSVFMKPGANGTILPARQSISAILLIGVHGRDSVVYGILHPEAAYPFNQGFLPEVPFIRIAKWPIVDGKIWTEWVIANPSGKTVPHWKISLPRPKRKRVDPRETVSVDE
jgi:hypothetical protein